MNRFTKKQTLTFLLPAVMLLVSPLRIEAQKKSAINPSIDKTLQNVGWRSTPTNTEEAFEIGNPVRN